jgi:small conductance mechanosensitive channel
MTTVHGIFGAFAAMLARLPMTLDQFQVIAARVGVILLICFVALIAVRGLATRIERGDGGSPEDTLREQRGRTAAHIILSFGRAVIIVAGVLMILSIFVDIGPLLAGAGIVGLAISFGSQSIVRDFVTGFFLLLEDQFALGEHVRIGNFEGIVERVTLRVVHLRDPDGALHIVSNGEIKQVSNFTRAWGRAVVDVELPVHGDVDRAIKLLERVGAELFADDRWRPALLEKPYVTGIERLGEASVTLRIVAKTGPRQREGVARELRRRVKNAVDGARLRAPLSAAQ